MNSHVTQCAAAEIKNLSPLTRMINLFGEVPDRRGAQPKVPVECFGDGGFFSVRFAVIAPVLEAPHVNLFDFTNDAGLNVVSGEPIWCARRVLDTHLGGKLLVSGKRS